MKKSFNGKTVAVLLCVLVLIASYTIGCGNLETELSANDSAVSGTDVAKEKVEEFANTIDIKSLSSEEDFKNAINQLMASADKDVIAEVYDAYSRKYQLDETGYVEYAKICGELGDTQKQRELLWQLYRLDPTKEHGDLLSECINVVSDENVSADIMKDAAERLGNAGTTDFDLNYFKELFASSGWMDNFFLDTGIYTSHTRYDGEYTIDVYSDQVSNTISISKDGHITGIKTTAIGSTVFSCGIADNGYSGDFYINDYDENDELIKICKGTIADGHCVNDLSIVFDGTEYKGHFNENGVTTETQPDGLSGVVYAYDESGVNYLYEADCDPASWTADIEYIGLKGIEK